MTAYLMPLYLLLLAGFLLALNVRVRGSAGAKWLSYVGMWAAVLASLLLAIHVYLRTPL